MQRTRKLTPAAQGFTLIEVMVGLVLGMIGIIIMYQVFAVFEGQRRTTVTGGNAQTSGHLSMYGMERDLKLAGLGMFNVVADPGTPPADYRGDYACAGGIRTYDDKNGLGWAGAGAGPALPVRILDGGNATDEFTVTYGASALGGTAAPLVGTGVSTFSELMNNWVKVKWVPFLNAAPDASNRLLNKGDFVVLAQPDGTSYRCLRLKITAIQRSAAFPDSQYLQMKFDPGNKPPDGQPENPPDTVNDFFPPGGGGYIPSAGSYVKPMGRALNWVRYSVDSATMQLVSQASGEAATPVAEGVVSLQVQYGVGAKDNDVVDGVTCTKGWAQPACQRVIRWVTATNGAGFDGVNWGNLVNEADVRRIKAVRVAIVVRSENLERDTNPLAATPGLYGVAGSGKPIIVVPGACAAAGQVTDLAGRMCVWEDGVNAVDGSTAAAPQVDLSKRPDGATAMPDWDRYRYKVYETTVPMRNVMWSTKGS